MLAERLVADELQRRSKAASGDQPSGSRPGRPCPESGVNWNVVPVTTEPAGTVIVTLLEVSVPFPELMETGAASGVRRASTGTVPTPCSTKTSRSTVVVVGELLDATRNTCESVTCSE